MNAARFLRHIFFTRWTTRRYFTPQVLGEIETAIRETESLHAGEIRFVVETALDLAELVQDLAPRQRAMQVFGQLGVWDTAENNGVLIYLLLADHVVEIVADRGIAARIAQSQWEEVCREMERYYRERRFGEGSVAGVRGVGRLLSRHFPGRRADADELPNQPVLL
ncbi:MAG: TPM domain-containing protein [Steroidobacteraceae bacterium]